jgi:hypothetical protein
LGEDTGGVESVIANDGKAGDITPFGLSPLY